MSVTWGKHTFKDEVSERQEKTYLGRSSKHDEPYQITARLDC